MKRHPALIPFSRDHYGGLVVAQHLMRSPDDAALAECLKHWKEEMQDHFSEEESLLSPLAPAEMTERLIAEHNEIRSLMRSAASGKFGSNDIFRLGKKVHDHIRWEERELFPTLERYADVKSIGEQTAQLEERRNRDRRKVDNG